MKKVSKGALPYPSVPMGTLDKLAEMCREDNDTWWRNPATGKKIKRNKGELLMLMVSEIAEAMEGERKELMSNKLNGFLAVEEELADLLIRVFDYAGEHRLRLDEAFWIKRAYNKQRPDHKPENRIKPGGKKF